MDANLLATFFLLVGLEIVLGIDNILLISILTDRLPAEKRNFARMLGKYVRQDALVSLEDAVRKMTWSNAQILGLRDRGMVKEGMFADLVIFDPTSITDHATFTQPHQLSTGVRDVFVNGVAVWRAGKHTGAKPGRALRGAGYAGSR